MAEIPAADKLALDRQIDRVAHAFEQALRRGEAPRIEQVCQQHADLGVGLRRELLAIELEHKLLASEIDWPAYHGRFPDDAAHLEQLRQKIIDRFAPALADTSQNSDQGSVTDVLSKGPADPQALPAPELPLAPLSLDDYCLEQRLGKGGQGEVHLARQRSLDRLVAVKLLLKSTCDEALNVQRFLREAKTLAQTHHPHIVTIHGLGRVEDGGYFLVMEYVAGPDLSRQIRDRAFAPAEAARIVAQIAGAIEHAHQRGVIHRDLKPSNVLWDAIRGPVVTDFGLAKDLRAADDLTLTEQMMGTPAYMAPEQASRRFGEVSTQTDVYGLGATLFALLTGQGPYSSGSIAEVLQQLTSDGPIADPRAVRPEVPEPLAAICRRALARFPTQRFASAAALAAELERWLAGKPLSPAPTVVLPPKEARFGEYRLVESLTSDPTRRIYRAAAPNGQAVLLKFLPAEWLGDRLKRSQFRQEVLLSSRLKHRCLAKVVEVGTFEQAEFIALEHLDGESLAQVLARDGRLDAVHAGEVLLPIAEVLHQIHQAGVIYRDLRPQNILLTPAGQPMLAEVRFSQELDRNDNMTMSGWGPVTALYIAPELMLGGSSNVLSDVYTLGATLYALATGHPPFEEASDALSVMIQKNERRYADPREHAPELRDAVVELMAAALHPQPAQRPPSAEEFGKRLEQALANAARQEDSLPTAPSADGQNLLHAMWDQLDAELQDAFALAYNKKRRTGSTRISTQDVFQALARLGTGDLRRLIDELPRGALPEPADPSIPTDRAVLREQPLLSDCVWDSLSEFRKTQPASVRLAPVDLFVDVAKHGHGASVVRLREHGVDPDVMERIVQKLGLKVVRRQTTTSTSGLAAKELIWDDNVQFSVYRPKAIQPESWERMLVFAHLAELPPDAAPDAIDPVEEVRRQAEQALGAQHPVFQTLTSDSTQAIPREGELTLVPRGEGLEFNPPSRTFRWLEPVHREEFRFRAAAHLDGQLARGRLSVFLGSILIAEVSLVTRVDRRANESPEHKMARHNRAGRFRRIYACVSPEDEAVAEQFRRYAETTRDSFLTSQLTGRDGGLDSPRQQLIRSADVFQLYWSNRAMSSPDLEQEWRFALSLARPEFIRPLYWEEPFPRNESLPPAELMALGFFKIPMALQPVRGKKRDLLQRSIDPELEMLMKRAVSSSVAESPSVAVSEHNPHQPLTLDDAASDVAEPKGPPPVVPRWAEPRNASRLSPAEPALRGQRAKTGLPLWLLIAAAILLGTIVLGLLLGLIQF